MQGPTGCSGVQVRPNNGQSLGVIAPRSTSPQRQPRGSTVVGRPSPNEPPVTKGAAARPITTTTLDQISGLPSVILNSGGATSTLWTAGIAP